MKIAITGSLGFIGSHLGNYLTTRGYEVIGFDNYSSPSDNPTEFCTIDKSIHDLSWYFSTFRERDRPTVIMHLAAKVNVDESGIIPQSYLYNNINGTQEVIEACLKYNIGLIYASSSEVYGNADEIPITESAPTRCESIYAVSKLAGEKLVGVAHQTRGLNAVRLRVFNTYGPYQRESPYGAMIPIFVGQALRGEPITIFGGGRQARDYIHVDDVCRAYEMSLMWLDEGLADPINIGTGASWSVSHIADQIAHVLNPKVEVKHIPARLGEVKCLQADRTVARKLGFAPAVSFVDGLTQYIRWRQEGEN